MKRDHYEVLGIPKTASQEDIKKAYKKKAKEFHPDVSSDDKAEEKFKEISESFEVLSDENKKAQYDAYGHAGAPRGRGQGGFSDQMADFFRQNGFGGFGGRQVRKGRDLNLTIKLSLEEIYSGTSKKVKYNRKISCDTCVGHGGTGVKTCTTCGGSGMREEIMNSPFGQIISSSECNVCGGSGSTYEDICKTCNGEGLKSVEDIIDLNIPSGVANGMKFQMQNLGDAIKAGTSGNLIISILELPHSTFVRSGNDLRMNLKLKYEQLILGDKLEISTIEGSRIKVTIPEYTRVSDVLKIQEKGLKAMNSASRGDLLLEIDLFIPTSISQEQRDLINKLKEISQ